jgi:hypothetical protein
MKYAFEISSGTMTHIPKFVKIALATQKLMGGISDTQHVDRISLLLFFQKEESRIKINAGL